MNTLHAMTENRHRGQVHLHLLMSRGATSARDLAAGLAKIMD